MSIIVTDRFPSVWNDVGGQHWHGIRPPMRIPSNQTIHQTTDEDIPSNHYTISWCVPIKPSKYTIRPSDHQASPNRIHQTIRDVPLETITPSKNWPSNHQTIRRWTIRPSANTIRPSGNPSGHQKNPSDHHRIPIETIRPSDNTIRNH